MKIVFCAPAIDAGPWVARLARSLPEAQVWPWSPAVASREADYAVVWSPHDSFFAGQRRLRAVFNMGAGVDRLLRLPGLPREVPLFRLDDTGKARQMAEYVCHALIGHARRFGGFDAQQRAGVWRELPVEGRAAFPVGVMGLGAIGARVAQAVASFGYPVLGWSRSRKAMAGVTGFAGPDEFDSFLRATRVLVCVLPLTPQTDGIVNATNLRKLKPGAYVINVGRSSHVVDADLLAQIDAGHVAGATLDVFATEPLPDGHAFWRHPNIRGTPHIAASTGLDESIDQIVAKIRAIERGEAPLGRVDFERGY